MLGVVGAVPQRGSGAQPMVKESGNLSEAVSFLLTYCRNTAASVF